jgi:uncharacterized protein (DUF1330 family)
MAKGYWVAAVDVRDMDAYQEYRAALAAPLREFGGAFLTRGGQSEQVEGKLRTRVVILEFPSYAAALACYRSRGYRDAKKLRLAASDADVVILEGYDGPQPAGN